MTEAATGGPFKVVAFAGASNWPYWAAEANGLFAREGLEVTLDVAPDSVEMSPTAKSSSPTLRLLRPQQNTAKVLMQHFDETVLFWRWSIRRALLNSSAGRGRLCDLKVGGSSLSFSRYRGVFESEHLYVDTIAPLSVGR
ncbi:MAG: hypothetical protein WBP94_07970 [Rhodomicrobiaceae bacterium]